MFRLPSFSFWGQGPPPPHSPEPYFYYGMNDGAASEDPDDADTSPASSPDQGGAWATFPVWPIFPCVALSLFLKDSIFILAYCFSSYFNSMSWLGRGVAFFVFTSNAIVNIII